MTVSPKGNKLCGQPVSQMYLLGDYEKMKLDVKPGISEMRVSEGKE